MRPTIVLGSGEVLGGVGGSIDNGRAVRTAPGTGIVGDGRSALLGLAGHGEHDTTKGSENDAIKAGCAGLVE
jgi:hypothetical protein